MTNEWRIILGDLTGRPIANYSTLARGRTVTPRFMRPDSFTARVPSSHNDVGGTHTDGLPKLEALCRTIRAFRREQQADGSFAFVCRHSGIVWTVQDEGDEDGGAWTTFTSYSPMQRLSTRFTGVDANARVGDAAQLAKQLVDDTNALGYTGISTSAALGAQFDVSTSRSVQYQRASVGQSILDLASAYNSFDLDMRPIYQAPGTEDGTLVVMSCVARKGSYKPNAVFAWGMSPHNVSRISREIDPSGVANIVTGIGGSLTGADGIVSTKTSPGSVARFGRYEAIDSSATGLTDQAFLDAIVSDEVTRSAWPSTIVNVTPATSDALADGTKRGRTPQPWTDFDLGDTVPVYASAALRGGYAGQMRVYGFTVNISDENVESMPNVVTSPEGI